MFKRYWWILLVMIPVGPMCGFLLAAIVSYLIPEKFESFATIEVKDPGFGATGEIPFGSGEEQSSGTELAEIKSRKALAHVAESLDLTNKWQMEKQSVVNVLDSVVGTQRIRGTDLISITVRYTDREDARDIAAEVARVYKEHRNGLSGKVFASRLRELNKAINEQENRVEEIMSSLKSVAGGPYLLDGSNLPEDPDGSRQATKNFEAFEKEQGLLEMLKLKLVAEEIRKTNLGDSTVVHDDPVIADKPVSPNVTMNLVSGSVAGLLLSPFLALPFMWLLNRRHQAEG